MSLHEYRSRMKSRPSSQDVTSRESSRSLFMSNILSRRTPAANPPDHPPPPPPPPPKSSPARYHKSVSEPTKVGAGGRPSKEEEGGKNEWSSRATLAEQIRERIVDESEQRSLTERLRKEFGLENLDDSDKDKGWCRLVLQRNPLHSVSYFCRYCIRA